MIFQGRNLLRVLTIEQNVQMGADLLPDLGYRPRRDRAREWLRPVARGEGRPLDNLLHGLPGGQKQQEPSPGPSPPRLLLADEPTAALDSRSGREVVDLLQALAREDGRLFGSLPEAVG